MLMTSLCSMLSFAIIHYFDTTRALNFAGPLTLILRYNSTPYYALGDIIHIVMVV